MNNWTLYLFMILFHRLFCCYFLVLEFFLLFFSLSWFGIRFKHIIIRLSKEVTQIQFVCFFHFFFFPALSLFFFFEMYSFTHRDIRNGAVVTAIQGLIDAADEQLNKQANSRDLSKVSIRYAFVWLRFYHYYYYYSLDLNSIWWMNQSLNCVRFFFFRLS